MDVPSFIESSEGAPLLISRATSYQSIDMSSTKEPDTVSLATTLTYDDYRPSSDEVLFRMKYAHLNKGVDWIDFIENTAGSEETKWSLQIKLRDSLKEQPLHISEKLHLHKYLKIQDILKAVKTKEPKPNKHKKERRLLGGVEFKLWENHITHISAYFGSNVASYFLFLRFLLYLNCFVGLVMLGFVCLPQIIPGDFAISSEVKGYFGDLSTSVMFFGAYSDKPWGGYERSLAYFLTWIAVYFFSFVIIVISMYLGYKRSKMDGQSDEFRFAYRVLASWDYSVTSETGVVDRKSAIQTDIKEMVREEKSNEESLGYEIVLVYIIRLIVNVTVFGILGGSGYLIYIVADITITPEELPDFLQAFFAKYELPVVVSGLKVIVPPVLCLLVKLERWHPRTEIKINIIRTALFYLASLVVFVTSLYEVSSRCVNSTENENSVKNVSEFCCWENEVGEEILKVVLLDLGLFILVLLLLDGVRAILVRCHAWDKLDYNDFDVTPSVLDLIYGQSLVWVGLYFSPFLALIQVSKLVVTFYFRYITARYCNTPPAKVFKASRSGTFYMLVLLINLFVSLFPMIYAVIVLSPSFDCGPFRLDAHVYAVLTSRIGNLPDWLQDALIYVSTSTVIVPLLIFLILMVLFYRAKTALYKNLIQKLRGQLTFERRVEKRKVFRKAKVSQGISSASGLDRIGKSGAGLLRQQNETIWKT